MLISAAFGELTRVDNFTRTQFTLIIQSNRLEAKFAVPFLELNCDAHVLGRLNLALRPQPSPQRALIGDHGEDQAAVYAGDGY